MNKKELINLDKITYQLIGKVQNMKINEKDKLIIKKDLSKILSTIVLEIENN